MIAAGLAIMAAFVCWQAVRGGSVAGCHGFVPRYQGPLIAAPNHPPGSMRQSGNSARDRAVISKKRSKSGQRQTAQDSK
jgi:hypothetical protein